MTRWAWRRISADDQNTALILFDTGWEPISAFGPRGTDLLFRKAVNGDGKARPIVTEARGFVGVEVRP